MRTKVEIIKMIYNYTQRLKKYSAVDRKESWMYEHRMALLDVLNMTLLEVMESEYWKEVSL